MNVKHPNKLVIHHTCKSKSISIQSIRQKIFNASGQNVESLFDNHLDNPSQPFVTLKLFMSIKHKKNVEYEYDYKKNI